MTTAAEALDPLEARAVNAIKALGERGVFFSREAADDASAYAAIVRAALAQPQAGEVEEREQVARNLDDTVAEMTPVNGWIEFNWRADIEHAARLLRATQSNGHSPDAGSASARQRVAEAGSCALTSAIEPATSVKDTEAATSGESPAPSAPAQPVAWRWKIADGSVWDCSIKKPIWNSEPLYAAPPQSAPAQEPAYILDPRNGRWDYRHPGMSKAIHELYAYAAPPQDEAVALLREVVRRYDDYRGKGVLPAPGEYQMVVGAIERIRAFLTVETANAAALEEVMKAANAEAARTGETK